MIVFSEALYSISTPYRRVLTNRIFQRWLPPLALTLGLALPVFAQLGDEMSQFEGQFGNAASQVRDEADEFGAFERFASMQEKFGLEKVEHDGGTDFDSATGNLTLNGNVHINASLAEIFADKVRFDSGAKKLYADGDVSIYKDDGFVYRGESAVYDTQTGEIDAAKLRSTIEPIFFEAGDFDTATRDISVVNLKDAVFTTHDNVNYDYHFKAREMQIYPDDKVVMKHVKAYVGDVPVFYFPRITQAFDEELGYRFTPGYRSNWGAFLSNQYGQMLGDHSIVTYRLDFRSERGVAGGLDLTSRRFRDNPNIGKFQFYYAQDSDPTQTIRGTSEDRSDIDEGRYRINLQHRIYLPGPEESTFYVDINMNKLSDEFFYQDFFPGEFIVDPQPDNIVSAIKQFKNAELSITGRFDVNDFFQTDTRSPEIALDFVRHPLWNSGVFYTGSNSVGVYAENLAAGFERDTRNRVRRLEGDLREAARPDSELLVDVDETNDMLDNLNSILADTGFTRFQTYHELSLPRTYGGWLSLTPRVGAGYIAYSDIDGPQPENDGRGIVHAGVEASGKFSKSYPSIQIPSLGVEEIKHVLQPYVHLSYTNTDDMGGDFKRIDRLVPSTRPRPLDVPEFTAIDDLNSWTIVRTGMYNRLYTKRNENAYPWLAMNTWIDTYIEDPEYDRDFSNLFNDVQWNPLPWLRLNVGAQLPIAGGDESFTEMNTRVTWMPSSNFEVTLGHRLLQDHPFFEDSDLIDLRAYLRINDNWGAGMYHRYEIEDSTLETQQYSIHRDLNSWTGSLGAVIRDNRGGEADYGLVFMLTLKDFPQLSIPIDVDPNPGGGR
ncbi:MAG: LPS-assembly protein [Verrucomicrobiales bacterium]|jgi:LPS-assembly protein